MSSRRHTPRRSSRILHQSRRSNGTARGHLSWRVLTPFNPYWPLLNFAVAPFPHRYFGTALMGLRF
jgi:hypothetical protein